MSGLNAVGRLAFGTWIVLLGLNHWMAFLPPPGPGTELSSQLVAAFDDTGLLGIVSGLLVICGVLTLANRMTVLALVGTMPVMVCGAFWAIVLRGQPGLIAPALAGMSVNALLLVSYWPHVHQLFVVRAGSAVETGIDQSAFWRRTEAVSRYVWGGWYVASGLYHFVIPPLYGDRPLAVQLIAALVDTGLYELVKGTEFLGGALVLARRWAPLALLINAPVTLVVMYWDGYLQGEFGPLGLLIVFLTGFFTVVMMRAYREYYRPLLAWQPRHVGQIEDELQPASA